jgi:PAS domain S-box-containing protein
MGTSTTTIFKNARGSVFSAPATCTPVEKLRFDLNVANTILEKAGEAIYLLDADGHVVYMNPAAERMFGWKQHELDGKRLHDLIHYQHPDGTPLPFDQCPLANVIAVGVGVQNHENVFFKKGGTPVNVYCSNAPVFSRKKLIGAVLVVADITSRKRAEQALAEASLELGRYAGLLENRVAERTRELEEKNKALEAFCYTIAHDLRAPLRAIQSFTGILLEEFVDTSSAEARDYADRVVRATHKMDKLLADLLIFGRATCKTVQLEPVSLEDAVSDVLFDLSGEIAAKEASVKIKKPLHIVYGNATVIRQVFTNLLTNSLKFVRPSIAPEITIFAEVRAAMIRVVVQDNGIGIPAPYLDRVFRLFERVHSTDYTGSGVGLAIVQHGVERLGGQVGVESVDGCGSRFWIELPSYGGANAG